MKFTAYYRKLEHGYMGKLLEWPGVITEGDDLDDCRECLIDAAKEMALAYYEDGREIPNEFVIAETLSIPLEDKSSLEDYSGHHDVMTNGDGKYITIKQAEEFDEYTVSELCKEAGIQDMNDVEHSC
ncbi:MAG: type II toxin-antitoxin system HicB family antitoxin [Synergistaceae bacterium]|nr:type II toxin-antitoxin system HicB family antitoxin [Synergistaceae bacterium]